MNQQFIFNVNTTVNSQSHNRCGQLKVPLPTATNLKKILELCCTTLEINYILTCWGTDYSQLLGSVAMMLV